MKRAVLFLLAPLLLGGCSSQEMMDSMDRGIELEIAGRKLERSQEPAKAIEKYAAAAKDYEHALEIAKERQTFDFMSFLWAKLSIVHLGQGRCFQPDNNPEGSWEQAVKMYRLSGSWAVEGRFLKMKEKAIAAEAFCMRPDKNPKGSWKTAGETYAKAAKLAKSFGDDEGRGHHLREQAICMLGGDKKKAPSAEIRFLLVKARQLGDEEAADMLVQGRYCMSCGEPLGTNGRFCPKCGKDQTIKIKKPKTFKLKHHPRPGEQGPPGAPPN